jgi:DNA-binding CsgD family transcriptional regulator
MTTKTTTEECGSLTAEYSGAPAHRSPGLHTVLQQGVSPTMPSRKLPLIWALFALQAFCAVFFMSDAVFDVLGIETEEPEVEDSISLHDAVEYLIAAALVLGTIFTGFELRRAQQRQAHVERQLKAASGAFAEVMEQHFQDWGLTASDRDVALFAIKGLSISEIAEMRETREGTIKAQCNAIYRKAGVTGRPQLISLFVEELMGADMTTRHAGA